VRSPRTLGRSYWAKISKGTISRITSKVTGEMAGWRNRPLGRICPVLFIGAIVVKVRDGQAAQPTRLRRHRGHRQR
jgi:transposase-like protein